MLKTLTNRAQKKEPPVNVVEVRVALLRRGYSVNRWATERGFNGIHAHLAIWGKRRGPIARRIIAALKADLEIQ